MTQTTILMTAGKIDWITMIQIYGEVLAIGLAFLTTASIGILILKMFGYNIKRLKEFFEDDDKMFSMSRLLMYTLVLFYCSNATYLVIAWHTFTDVPYSLVMLLITIYGVNQNKLSEIASAWKGGVKP